MPYQNKLLWLIGLAVVFAMALMGGCDGPTNGDGRNKETYYEWHEMDVSSLDVGQTARVNIKADISDMVYAGKFYIGTKRHGLIVWNGLDESKGFTKVDLTKGFKPSDSTDTKDLTDGKIKSLVVLRDKYVAFISETKGIGTVEDITAKVAWEKWENNINASDINTLAVIPKDAVKYLYAATTAKAKSVLFQKLGQPFVDDWDNTLQAADKHFDKAATALALDNGGNLLLAMPNTNGDAGFKSVAKADIGLANKTTVQKLEENLVKFSADDKGWKKKHINVNAAHMMGQKLVVGTDETLVVVDTSTGTSKELGIGEVFGLKADGTNGVWAFLKGNGALYVKADGTLDASKAINAINVNVNFYNQSGGVAGTTYRLPSENIITFVDVGKKTYFATTDAGILVREEKERDKLKP